MSSSPPALKNLFLFFIFSANSIILSIGNRFEHRAFGEVHPCIAIDKQPS